MKPETRYENEFSLLEDFRSSNMFALQTIYDMHYHAIWNFANRFLKDDDQTDDTVAESFIKVWQKRAEFDSLKGIAYFLYTITRNACISHLKKARTREKTHKEIAYLFGRDEGSDALESVRNDLVQWSIIEAQHLPDKMREVFQLLYIEGFSAAEVADKLELSTHTVWAQKRNAVKRVRENLIKKGLLSWLF
jgi:RNA polymerase sigma-70 factor (ECF subfamily)